MSVGPLGGVLGSAAGAPLAQTKGSETERSASDNTSRARGSDADRKAEQASGVGQTQEDQGASDRDADGRRLWEAPPEKGESGEDASDTNQEEKPTGRAAANRVSKDPTGAAGGNLDLMG